MKKKLLLIIALCAAFASQAQITINQMPVVHDPLSNMLLCSVPENVYGKDLPATIMLDDNNWDAMIIDGDTVTSITPYTFKTITGGKNYPIKGIVGQDTTDYFIAFTYYPILMLHSLEGAYHQRRYKNSIVTIIQPGEQAEVVNGKAKWRGNTTVRYYREKRNYHLKFTDENGEKMDRRMFPDLRKDNSWILDAGQVDMARIRNKVGMELWNDLTPPMYYSDREPNAMNGVNAHMIELFLEGNYHGIYSMGEAVDRKQMKLKKYDEDTKEIHGQLFKSSAWNDYTMMGNDTQDYDPASDEWQGYDLKYPDLEDVNPADWTTLWEAIHFVVRSSDDEFRAHVGEYFDLPVLQYYYILYELLVAFDNGGKNMYWAVYDKQEDKKLTLAAWDFDATVGQYYINVYSKKDEKNFSPERDLQMGHILFSRLIALDVDGFKTNMLRRYYTLRKTMFTEENLTARYVNAINDLQRCGAAQREEIRWSGVVDLNYKDLDFEYQKGYIADWWHRRLIHLDSTFFNVTPMPGDVNRDWQVDVTDVNDAIDVVLGEKPFDADADLNHDGQVDVDDISALIDIVLGK